MTNVKRSKKICSKDDCNYPLFARGFCRYHYNSDYLAPKQALKAPKSYTIPKITAKRRSQVTKYHSERKVFIQAERDFNPRKEIYCIFCDEIIYEIEPDVHHGDGRDDEKLLDTIFWYIAHNFCHVHQYHSMSCKDIPWWDNYMFRMQYINPKVYQKDLLRQSKS